MGLGGFFEGSGDGISGDVEVFTEVVDTLVGEFVVVPLPVELHVDVASRMEGLHQLDNMEVGNFNQGILDGEVLGGNHNTLLEKVGVDGESVFLGN